MGILGDLVLLLLCLWVLSSDAGYGPKGTPIKIVNRYGDVHRQITHNENIKGNVVNSQGGKTTQVGGTKIKKRRKGGRNRMAISAPLKDQYSHKLYSPLRDGYKQNGPPNKFVNMPIQLGGARVKKRRKGGKNRMAISAPLKPDLAGQLTYKALYGSDQLTNMLQYIPNLYNLLYPADSQWGCPAPDSFGQQCIHYFDQCSSDIDCVSPLYSCCLVAGCGRECVVTQNPIRPSAYAGTHGAIIRNMPIPLPEYYLNYLLYGGYPWSIGGDPQLPPYLDAMLKYNEPPLEVIANDELSLEKPANNEPELEELANNNPELKVIPNNSSEIEVPPSDNTESEVPSSDNQELDVPPSDNTELEVHPNDNPELESPVNDEIIVASFEVLANDELAVKVDNNDYPDPPLSTAKESSEKAIPLLKEEMENNDKEPQVPTSQAFDDTFPQMLEVLNNADEGAQISDLIDYNGEKLQLENLKIDDFLEYDDEEPYNEEKLNLEKHHIVDDLEYPDEKSIQEDIPVHLRVWMKPISI